VQERASAFTSVVTQEADILMLKVRIEVIRTYFRRAERDSVYVRCEPNLGGKKPDIVTYEEGDPIYMLEFKFYPNPDSVNEDSMLADLDKLSTSMKRFPTVRWCFFHMIYGADVSYTLSDAQLRRLKYEKMSATAINARRHTESGNRRKGYDEWRARFDQLQDAHREHA
jgi:hypothetical protein